MMLFLQYATALVLILVFCWILWESTMMIEEKKERRRKGLTDYYDNPIKKGNKDEH